MHCTRKFMLICKYSRRCSNATCFHKKHHIPCEYHSCENARCVRYSNESVVCIEVKYIGNNK